MQSFDFSGERRTALPNGAQLLSFSAPHLNSVAFSVVMPFIPEATPGVYHFVEHMFFERAGKMRARQINARMNAHGSEIMGYTAINYMCFNFSCRKEVFAAQLDLLFAMLSQREYGEEEFEKVLPVVRNEIFEYEFYDTRAGDILGSIRAISIRFWAAPLFWNGSGRTNCARPAKGCFPKISASFWRGHFRKRTCARSRRRSARCPL